MAFDAFCVASRMGVRVETVDCPSGRMRVDFGYGGRYVRIPVKPAGVLSDGREYVVLPNGAMRTREWLERRR